MGLTWNKTWGLRRSQFAPPILKLCLPANSSYRATGTPLPGLRLEAGPTVTSTSNALLKHAGTVTSSPAGKGGDIERTEPQPLKRTSGILSLLSTNYRVPEQWGDPCNAHPQ